MPIRPDQHDIEDISRAKLKLILPRKWVLRDKEKDYGIDCEVELFDTEGQSQGLMFLVQLKATESTSQKDIFNIDLKIDRLLYYRSLDLPVILIRYSHSTDEFYAKWIYNVDLTFVKESAKTIQIKLSADDKINESNVSDIEYRLKILRNLKNGNFNFPIPYSFDINDINDLGVNKNFLQNKLKKELNKHSYFIEFSSVKERSGLIISIKNNELKINFCDVCGCSYHNLDKRTKENFYEEMSNDILLGISLGLIDLGKVDMAGLILFNNNLEHKILSRTEIAMRSFGPLLQSSFFDKTLDLAAKAVENSCPLELDLLLSAAILIQSNSKTGKHLDAITKFLENRLNFAIRSKNQDEIGRAHYNLANHFNGKSNYLLSIRHYIQAKRYSPAYLKQHYYYSELASNFFFLEKYRFAARYYEKSLHFGSDTINIALAADSLMFSGQYKKALEMFDKYINSSEEPSEEFILKKACLEYNLLNLKIEYQIRNSQAANALSDVSKWTESTNPKKILNEALKSDLLSGLAWFNLGLFESKENNHSYAAFCFTMAAIVNTGDTESWKNAVISAINSSDKKINLPLIIRVAYSAMGENFIDELYSELQHQLPDNLFSQFSQLIEEITSDINHKSNRPVLRIKSEDGSFMNFFDMNFK